MIKNTLLYNILEQIANNTDIEVLIDIIKVSLSDMYEISDFNVLYFDEQTMKFVNAIKDFEPAEDYFSSDKLELFAQLYNSFGTKSFVLNDDESIPDDVFDTGEYVVKSLSLPLKYDNKLTGLMRFRFKQKEEISSDDILLWQIISSNLAVKLENIFLRKRLETNLEFYKSMKDIAKIIETQYDYQYITPLIGEMIDKFVMNHLIYIFLKQDDKYNLYWPNACWNKQVYELIEKLTPQNSVVLSENKNTGVFGLVSQENLIGCIVAHSTIDKLSDNEMKYIMELTEQSAITLEKANVYSEMLKNATLDALTGLNNRGQFELRLKEQYSIANRQQTPLCAIMTDIDFFKKFNDNYGHSVGDMVLKATAGVIKQELREYDIASRYGGEEFCILLPNTSINEARVVAERLRSAVESTKLDVHSEKTLTTEKISITISVGLAELEVNDMPEDLHMKADKALYDAKEGGRNRVVVYAK